jgi:hypothetical protein
LEIRTGIAWHPDGSVRSVEPSSPLAVETPLGKIHAFDADVVGLTGDENSLEFDPAGRLKALATSTDVVNASGPDGALRRFAPQVSESLCNPLKNQTYPLLLHFAASDRVEITVRYSDAPPARLNLAQTRFEIQHRHIPLPPALPAGCAC